MEQVILLLPLLHLHLEFRVLLLLLDGDQLAKDVPEEFLVVDRVLAVVHDLVEHVLEAHHVVGAFFKGEVHDPQHNDYEMLDFDLLVWQFFKLLLNDLQLSIEDQSTDLGRRVFRQVLNVSLLQEFLNKTYDDFYPFLLLNEVPKRMLLLLGFLLFFQPELL